jgi:hypothetical protein
MKRIKLNKKRQLQLRFNYLFNKKSNYLKNLPKLKYDGLKEIENEKVEILIDKFLGINKFERDYSFFNPPLYGAISSRKEQKKKKLTFLPNLKILITSPIEKDYPDRYKQKEYTEDEFSNIYKNSNNNSLNKSRNKNIVYGCYKPINVINAILSDNENKKKIIYYRNRDNPEMSSSIFTGTGKNIINNNTFEKENLNISIAKINNFNQKYVTIK